MNVQTIQEYTKIIFSWPTVTLVALVMFQRELRELIGRIQKIQKGDLSIDIPARQQAVNKKTFEKLAAKKPDSYEVLYGFEKTYRLIFGSQLFILNLIQNAPQQKIDEEALINIHKRTMWRRTYPFTAYIGFLLNTKLLTVNKDNTYSLSKMGKLFLEYLKKNNIPLQKSDRIFYT